jgi:hypothetical protein
MVHDGPPDRKDLKVCGNFINPPAIEQAEIVLKIQFKKVPKGQKK